MESGAGYPVAVHDNDKGPSSSGVHSKGCWRKLGPTIGRHYKHTISHLMVLAIVYLSKQAMVIIIFELSSWARHWCGV